MAATAHWDIYLDVDVKMEIVLVRTGRDLLGKFAVIRTNGQEIKMRVNDATIFDIPYRGHYTPAAPLRTT